MDLTQEQFEKNLMAMPEEDKLSVLTVMEQSEPEGLVNFAEALGVNLIMGEEEGEEAVVAEAPVLEEPVAEEGSVPVEPTVEEPVDPAAVAAIEGVPPAEPASVLPPPAVPEPVPERPIDQEMQALAEGGDIQNDELQPGSEDALGDLKPEAQLPEISGEVAVEGADPSPVADGVAVKLNEGAFVLNKASRDYAGHGDIDEMFRKGKENLQKRGKKVNIGNITDPSVQTTGTEDVLVSNGEIIISKQMAEEIGYDRLEKINERGKIATEKKIQEQQAQEQQQPAQEGFKKQEIPVRAA